MSMRMKSASWIIIITLLSGLTGCHDVSFAAIAKHTMDFDTLVWTIAMAESSGNERAVGKAGERGLMQLTRAKWEELSAEPWDRAFDGATNLQVGAKLVARLEARYGSDDPAYIAYRYNRGEHTAMTFNEWKLRNRNKIYRSLYE